MHQNSEADEIVQHRNAVNIANISETGSEQDPRDNETKFDGMKAHIETWWTFFGQSSLPFFISGIGLIAAGLFFERAQHWAFFTNIPEAVVIVPALLGLKGNLETTYASRLSTLSNKGELETNDEILWTLAYNICLIEAQAIVMSFLVSIISVALSLIHYNFELRHAILVTASAMSAAAIASILLACLIAAVVVLSSKCGINPDNVSSPIAASIGDLITLAVLVGAGSLMLPTCTEQQCLFSLAIAVGIILVTPMLSYFAISTENTKGVLLYGWWSIVAGALIGCGGGLILQKAVIVFPGLAVFHPLITGLGGNRVSVQSSRQCTSLHICGYPLGTLPDHTSVSTYLNPFRVFCAPGLDSKVAIVILFGAAPFNMFFVILIFLTAKNAHFTWTFVGAYILFAFVQLAILLYLCQVIVHILWEIGCDPDHSSAPLLTATSDLLGTALLYTLFLFLQRFAPYAVCIQILDEPLLATTSINFTSGI
uniref:SLC41A/MgtE integral membrane domain-containing protein n=1 Tax=Parascaris univalens TaxID=6257 RepID=A0A915AEQ7_PARUN